MRVVILTGRQPHHKHFCGQIAARHDVVGVVHPGSPGILRRRHPLRSLYRNYGGLYALLRIGAKLPTRLSGWKAGAETARAEANHFPQAADDYDRIDGRKIFYEVDVNATSGIQLIDDLAPDVVINLGGAIYREDLIGACGLFLNYHSGLSPVYNGAGTVNFAFANGHPHLCGGTLMTMSPVIDGGVVLAHYLPEIEAGDTPATLSMKTYAGAAILYDRFLTGLAEGGDLVGAPQQRPIFYVKGAHWTLYQTLLTRHHLSRDLVNDHLRPERIVEYWSQPDTARAEALLNRTLCGLLWGAT